MKSRKTRTSVYRFDRPGMLDDFIQVGSVTQVIGTEGLVLANTAASQQKLTSLGTAVAPFKIKDLISLEAVAKFSCVTDCRFGIGVTDGLNATADIFAHGKFVMLGLVSQSGSVNTTAEVSSDDGTTAVTKLDSGFNAPRDMWLHLRIEFTGKKTVSPPSYSAGQQVSFEITGPGGFTHHVPLNTAIDLSLAKEASVAPFIYLETGSEAGTPWDTIKVQEICVEHLLTN